MSLKKNLLKNGVATGLQKVIRVAEQLFLVPFFISSWGISYYGEWLTLTTIPSMLAFADLGFGSAAANSLVLFFASGDVTGATKAAKGGRKLITYAIFASLLFSAILLASLTYFGVFDKVVIPLNDALLAISLLMTGRIISFYQQLYEGYYRAARRSTLSINLQSAYSCSKLVASLIVLTAGYGIVSLALTDMLISLIFNTYYTFKAKQLLTLPYDQVAEVSKQELKVIAKKGMGYLMSPIWQAIFFQGTTMAVRITLGAEAVALFNTLRTISRSVNQFFSIINGTVFPDLQFEIGSGRFNRARQVFRIAISISFFASVLGLIFLSLAGPWLYSIWTKNALHPPALMWNYFLLGILFNSLWWTACVVYRATNKPEGFAIMGIIGAVISVALSFVLAKLYGITGAAFGSLALEIIMSLYVLPHTCKILHQSLKQLPKDILVDLNFLYKNLRNGVRSNVGTN